MVADCVNRLEMTLGEMNLEIAIANLKEEQERLEEAMRKLRRLIKNGTQSS